MRTSWLILTAALLGAVPLTGQTPEETQAIRDLVIMHVRSWELGRADDMERSIHTRIGHKGIVNGRLVMPNAMELVAATREREGRVPETPLDIDVRILDFFRHGATVRVETQESIDYLHIGRLNGRWFILNYLFQLKNENGND